MKINQVCHIEDLKAALAGSGVQTVNIVFQANDNKNLEINKRPFTASDFPPDMVSMIKLIQAMKEPRLNNLNLLAMRAVAQMFDTKAEAASYLGISIPTLTKTIAEGKSIKFHVEESIVKR